MPRPKKPIDYNERLFRIDAQITKWKNTIQELEEERRLLLEQREQEEIAQLINLCKSSGLTVEELTALVQKELLNAGAEASA